MTTEEKAKAFDTLAVLFWLNKSSVNQFMEAMTRMPPWTADGAKARLMDFATKKMEEAHETA